MRPSRRGALDDTGSPLTLLRQTEMVRGREITNDQSALVCSIPPISDSGSSSGGHPVNQQQGIVGKLLYSHAIGDDSKGAPLMQANGVSGPLRNQLWFNPAR
jgi:hypothetical protein